MEEPKGHFRLGAGSCWVVSPCRGVTSLFKAKPDKRPEPPTTIHYALGFVFDAFSCGFILERCYKSANQVRQLVKSTVGESNMQPRMTDQIMRTEGSLSPKPATTVSVGFL